MSAVFAFAGVEPWNVRFPAAKLLQGYTIGIEDDKYPNVEVPGQSVVKSSVGQIILGIDQNILANNYQKFNFKVDVQIIAYDKTGAIIPVPSPITLEVKYNKDFAFEFKDKDIYVVKNCHKISAKILSVTYTDPSNIVHINQANAPSLVYMEAAVETERYYAFNANYQYPALNVLSAPVGNYEMEIRWPVVDGAEEYDLEWTYVNDYDGTPTGAIQPASLKYSFKDNATRVTVNQNFYRISLMFERGYVLYRLRARGRDLTNTDVVLYGNWNACPSLPCESNTVGNYSVNRFPVAANDDYKNWQYTASYAEEGKKKEVVSYFDGSLHNRQSLTKINTTNQVVVAENLYDFQGRPAVNVLPVPIDQQSLIYQVNFNMANTPGVGLFDKEDFDLDGGNCLAAPTIHSMKTSSGASNYYSPYNLNKDEQQAYVPDAQGFPFTQTEYTPDKTGRIRKQGGVGPDHQLGTGHETSYFYGQPEQSELDMMFGSEAGNYQHYKKNMVIDPNGQITNTYVDMYGKTIATSLAGNAPLNVDPLPGASQTIKSKYLPATPNPNIKVGNNTLLFTKDLLVNTAGLYSFAYEFDKEIFSIDCNSSQMCFNCVYNFSIKILDDCGNPVTGVPSITNGQTVGTLDSIAFACNGVIKFQATNPAGPPVSNPPAYVVNLMVGNYTIVKELTVNEAVADIYANQYVRKSQCIKPLSEFINEAMAEIDLSGCHVDCQACENELGPYSNHNNPIYADPNNPSYIPSYVYMTQAQFDAAVEECRAACRPITECDVMYQLMLADVSPSGQYAQYTSSSTGYDASTFPLSVLNTDLFTNRLPMSFENAASFCAQTPPNPWGTSPANWRKPKITIGANVFNEYRDENGVAARVYLNEISPGIFMPDFDNTQIAGPTLDVATNQYYVAPQHLKYLKDFVEAFADNPWWSRSLVEYHPEWGYYGLCSKLQDPTYAKKLGRTSEEFDAALRNVETFAAAVTAGFIGTLSDPAVLFNQDPFFDNTLNANIPLGANAYANFNTYTNFLNNVINNYKGSPKNLKQIVTQIVRCNNVYYGASTSNCEGLGFGDPNYVFAANATEILDKEWLTFREMYLAEKQKVIKNVINQLAKGSFFISSPNKPNDNGFYNGPIGIGNEYYDPWVNGMIVQGSFNPFWWWSASSFFPGGNPNLLLQMSTPRCYGYGAFDPAQPSNWDNWPYYVNKTKRYVSGDEALPNNMSVNSFSDPQDKNTLSNATNYAIYQATGQCPSATHFETFLNVLAETAILTTPGPTPLVLNDFFLKEMYDAVVTPAPSSFVSIGWQVTSMTGGVLTANFTNSSPGVIPFTLSSPGFPNGDWVKIKYFGDVFYMGQSPTNTYNFKIKGYVDTDLNPLTAPDEVQFTGKTPFVIGGCSFTNYCEPSQTAGQLLSLLNTLYNTETTPGTKDLLNQSGVVNINNGASPYLNVLTNKLKKPFGIPVAGTLIWNRVGTGTTPLLCNLIGSSPALTTQFSFNLSALTGNIPAYSLSSIQFFKSIAPDPSNPNIFTLQAFVGYENAIPKFLPVVVTITSPLATLYDLGKCGPPPNMACQSPQNQTLKDMEALLNEMSTTIVPSGNLDLTYFNNYTTLLQSYVVPNATPANNNIWSASVSNININNIQTLSAAIGAGPTACTLKFIPGNLNNTNSALNAPPFTYGNITKFYDIKADNSQINNGAYTGNFFITAQFGNNILDTLRLRVSTSCFQFKDCFECTASNQPNVIETFDTFTLPGSNVVYTANNPNPLINDNNQVCSIVTNNHFNFRNENSPSAPCNVCLNAETGSADHSGTANKNFMHVKFDFPISNTNPIDVWSYYSSTSNNLINVSPNTNYEFSFWFRTCPPTDKVSINSYINQQTYNQPSANPIPLTISYFDAINGNSDGNWHQAKGTWNSGNNTTADLDIRLDPNGGTNGYSGYFDLDEIVFKEKPCSPINHANSFASDSIPTYEPCDTMLTAIGFANALYEHQQYINDQKKYFKEAYLAHCLSTIETFSVQYTDRQHHYTLYYYDQAGNLIKTIPPAGVELLNLSAFAPGYPTTTIEDQIKNDRLNKTQTVFTEHRMATKYEYNSLNQLIKQSMPDHDAINNFQVLNTINGNPPTLPANVIVNGMDFAGQIGYLVGTDGTANPNNGVIYSTTDGGVSWAPATVGGFGNLNKVQDVGGGFIYAAGDNGKLLKSTDNGVNWSVVNVISSGPAPKVNDLYFFNSNSGIVVGDNGLMYSTANGGSSWLQINIGQGTTNLNAIYFSSALNGYIVGDNGKLFYTINGGANWLAPATPLSTNINLTGVQFHPPFSVALPSPNSGNGDLISGFVTGYDNTTNNGKTIFINNLKGIPYQSPVANPLNTVNYSGVVFNNGNTPAKQLNSISIYNANTPNTYTDDKVLTAGKNGEIYKLSYTNNSATWFGTLETLPSGFTSEITSVVYPTNTNVNLAFATAKNGKILKYTNTSNWTVISANANTTPLNGIYFTQPYSAGSSQVVAVGNGGAIIKSNDGAGSNFANVTQITYPKLNDVSISKNTPGLVFAVGNGGVILGKSTVQPIWTVLTQVITTNNLHSIHSNDFQNSIIAGQGGIILKINGGVVSQLPSTVAYDLNEVFFVDNNKGYIAGNGATNTGAVLTTNNGGLAWAAMSSAPVTALKGIHASGNTIMAAGLSGKIIRSINGAAFTDITPPSSSANLNQIKLLDNLTAYAFGANGTVLKTIDGGTNWNVQATQSGLNYNAVSFTSNGNAIIGGSGTNNLWQVNILSGDHSSRFWYDRLGRLIISQNAKQFNKTTQAYSYTKYDAFDRIEQVGEAATMINPQSLTNYNSVINENNYTVWANAATKTQVTSTVYDNAVVGPLTQQNLRKRVSAEYNDNNSNLNDGYVAATYYSYDIHGNVSTAVQDNQALAVGQQFKEIKYSYDVVSGNINGMKYQDDQPDAFYHKYYYDADNKLTNVYTSRNKALWEQDIKYFYYKHGPLARTEIGDEKVQGVDKAYNIHGWLKGVNSTTMKSERDPGKDGTPDLTALAYNSNHADLNKFISKDAFGFALSYYNNDYKAISVNPTVPGVHKYDATNRFNADPSINPFFAAVNNNQLFNGNIMAMETAIPTFATTFNLNANTQLSTYKYDQLDRVKEAKVFDANNVVTTNMWASTASNANLYKNSFTYDGNGNILTQIKYDQSGALQDQLNYKYDLDGNGNFRKNRLYNVNEMAPVTATSTDFEDQVAFTPAQPSNLNIVNTANNYGYDELGNLVRDNIEKIANIEWTVYGKIKSITRTVPSNRPDMEFMYDADGNRITKIMKPHDINGNPMASNQWIYTYYVRDIDGNIISTYTEDKSTSTYNVKEFSIYASNRVGVLNNSITGNFTNLVNINNTQYQFGHQKGNKNYELSNHLGNVLTVVSDRKTAITLNNSTTDHYEVEVLSATDYYAFGDQMPGRNYNGNYRFGFNGKENDNEVKNIPGSQVDYGLRIYDSRLGKFLSVDPLSYKFPYYSPYHFAGNSPIRNLDLDGAEDITYIFKQNKDGNGYTLFKKVDFRNFNGGKGGSLGHGIQVFMVNNKGVVKSDFKQTYEFSNESVPMSESISRSLSKVAPSVKVSYGNCMNDEKYEGKHGFVKKGLPIMAITAVAVFSGGTSLLAEGGGLLSMEVSLSSGASGLADLTNQLVFARGDFRKVNWTSVVASTVFKNPGTQAMVGTLFQSSFEDPYKKMIFGSKANLNQNAADIIFGTIGNKIGSKGGEIGGELISDGPGNYYLGKFIGETFGEGQGEFISSGMGKAYGPPEE